MLGTCPIAPVGGWGLQKPPLGVPIDRSHPLVRDLVFLLPANEGSGSSVSDVASGGSASLVNGPTWFGSERGIGVLLNGTSQYINVPDSTRLGLTGSFTIAIVAKITGVGSGSFNDLMRHAAAYAKGYHLRWKHIDSILHLRVERYSNSFVVYDTQNNSAYLNAWHVFLGRYNQGTGVADLWVDATKRNQTTGLSGGLDTSSTPLFLMGNTLDSTYIPGTFGLSAIWARAISDVEVIQFVTNPYCMFESAMPWGVGPAARPLIDSSLASNTFLMGAVA
jgi:hypothetical protein